MSQKNIPKITQVERMVICHLPFTKGQPLFTEKEIVVEEEIN